MKSLSTWCLLFLNAPVLVYAHPIDQAYYIANDDSTLTTADVIPNSQREAFVHLFNWRYSEIVSEYDGSQCVCVMCALHLISLLLFVFMLSCFFSSFIFSSFKIPQWKMQYSKRSAATWDYMVLNLYKYPLLMRVSCSLITLGGSTTNPSLIPLIPSTLEHNEFFFVL